MLRLSLPVKNSLDTFLATWEDCHEKSRQRQWLIYEVGQDPSEPIQGKEGDQDAARRRDFQ